jgi:hypothetical protein
MGTFVNIETDFFLCKTGSGVISHKYRVQIQVYDVENENGASAGLARINRKRFKT